MTKLTVFYDGACPLCRREIDFYRGLEGAQCISWVDVAATETVDVAPGLAKTDALARFHVMTADGKLCSGGAAFAALWLRLRAFRLFGRLFQVRPLLWCLEQAYSRFLKVRPFLQRRLRERAPRQDAGYPQWLVAELRSDHAGETGAVAIYRGILAVTRDNELRAFSEAHLATEQSHLDLLGDVLPKSFQSRLLPFWRIAGFLTGAVPALFGSKAVYATIDAVETFVDHHYAAQIERLTRECIYPELRALLERCRFDEIEHRDEARDALTHRPGFGLSAWCRLVERGSNAAVSLARRI